RKATLQGRPSAFESACHRFLCRVKHVGDLPGMETQHVAEHENGALPRRKQLQSGDETTREGFSGLLPGLGSRRSVGKLIKDDVRVRLEPDHLTQPSGLRRVKSRRQ